MRRIHLLEGMPFGRMALVSLVALALCLPVAARADSKKEQRFSVVSLSRSTTDATVDAALEGAGTFVAEKGQIKQGGGIYILFDNTTPLPRTILDSGTWEATDFVSYEDGFGSYGRIHASVLELEIVLRSDVDGTETNATLRLPCNIGPAGITTGEREGFFLTTDSDSFEPFLPPVGLTHISTPGRIPGR